MSRARRILRLAILVGGLGQIPGILALARLAGWLPALAIAALVSTPFYLRFVRGQALGDEERGATGMALLVFYAWWGASLMAGVLWLPTLAAAMLLGAAEPTRIAAAVSLGVGVLTGASGVTLNRRPRLRTVEVAVAGLDPALDGLRIGHLSDLHLGGHTRREHVRDWVDRVNAAGCDLVAVTGDLITMGDSHVDAVAEELSRLRAADTVAVCLGNHDYFADTSRLVAGLRRGGLEVLRNEGRMVERETGGRYYIGGVDDTWTRRADVARTLAARPADLPPSVPTIVLAHDPHLFPELAERGATLTLSGHTHGGQVAVPLLSRALNVARIAYRHTAGLYRASNGGADRFLYVNRGAGTTGPAIRIGSPSEIALIVLRAA